MKKICSKKDCHLAGIEQDINNFKFRNDMQSYRADCDHCHKKNAKKYREKNKKKIAAKAKIKYKKNKKKIQRYQKVYYIKNKKNIKARNKRWKKKNKVSTKNKIWYRKNKKKKLIKSKIWYKKNREKKLLQNKKWNKKNRKKINIRNKKRRVNDPAYRLRLLVSRTISINLKKNNVSKQGKSCFKFLPYTTEELKHHIEKQFEPWMNWNNQGKYIKSKWNDNDPTTWKWQLDHIIPHSTFNYISMDDQEFKDCWALSNLRPYSAKQNLLDGVNKIRHKT